MYSKRMRYFIFLFTLFIFNAAYSFDTVKLQTLPEYTSNNQQNTISNEEFNILEMKIFKKTFSHDSAKSRLERLEKEIFGMIQSGSDEDRFENLITASDYYLSGYRQTQSRAETQLQTGKKDKIDPRDYIVNYNFNDNSAHDAVPEYFNNNDSYDYNVKEKKPSKITKFFSDLVDILSSGVVTGYTLPMSGFGYDPFSTVNTIGGSDFSILPQFPIYMPQTSTYVKPYNYGRNPYIRGRRNYNPHYPKPYYNHNPYGNGNTKYQTGSGVKIIY